VCGIARVDRIHHLADEKRDATRDVLSDGVDGAKVVVEAIQRFLVPLGFRLGRVGDGDDLPGEPGGG